MHRTNQITRRISEAMEVIWSAGLGASKLNVPLISRSRGKDFLYVGGTPCLKGGVLCWHWASCPGKALAGAMEAALTRVLPGESTSPSCSLCPRFWRGFACLVLLAGALLWYSCASASSLCPAKCGRRCGSDCPRTSRGVKRRAPTFVHRHNST